MSADYKIALKRNQAHNPRCVWIVRTPLTHFTEGHTYCFLTWQTGHRFLLALLAGLNPTEIQRLIRAGVIR